MWYSLIGQGIKLEVSENVYQVFSRLMSMVRVNRRQIKDNANLRYEL